MKLLCAFVLALVCVGSNGADKLTCQVPAGDKMPSTWIDMDNSCRLILADQVKTEIGASMTYLAMGAHFAQDSVNRPGFSNFFFKSASEEREHAIKIIEYLLMRGQLVIPEQTVKTLLVLPVKPQSQVWNSGTEALAKALELEANVTTSIRMIIKKCEMGEKNDYHLVDYLTADFLDEQYKGERDLAGKLSTLSKMKRSYGNLGEFLFDKKLLNNEV